MSQHLRNISKPFSTLKRRAPRLFSWAVWHSCRMGARDQEQTRGRIGPQYRLGNLRVGELHFCPLCKALDQASSLSRKLAYVPGPTFGFVKPLASSGSHCTKWADEQHRLSRVRVYGSFPTFPPLYPHFNWPSGFWPCVKSCLVGGSDKYYGVLPGFLAGPSGIGAGWALETKSRLGA